MEILSRPYDSNEYKNLLKEASRRKPIVRNRTLRSVTKTYKSDSIAQSYLDWCTGWYFCLFLHVSFLFYLFFSCILHGFFGMQVLSSAWFLLKLFFLSTIAELAEKIDLARDDRLRTLNLLRGFFYWLEVKYSVYYNMYYLCKG